MPRAARLRLPHVPFHVLQRGHNRAACFAHAEDYRFYLDLLEEFAPLHACRIHAYVLMTNHVHLLLTPATAEGVTRLMSAINQRYVQHFNRKYRRTGSLWESRFRSSAVDSEHYFFTCLRYVESNPVRAGMVAYPGQYPWSSHRANAEGAPSGIVHAHALVDALGQTPEERRHAYRALFSSAVGGADLEAIRGTITGSRPLGGTHFIAAMCGVFGPRATRRAPGRPRKQHTPPAFAGK